MVTGAVAGTLSTISHVHWGPLLRRVFGFQDTIGTVSCYGVPGLVGAIAGVVSSAIGTQQTDIWGASYDSLFPNREGNEAPWHILGIVCSIGIGAFAGAVLGLIFAVSKKFYNEANIYYTDELLWEIQADFEFTPEISEEDSK